VSKLRSMSKSLVSTCVNLAKMLNLDIAELEMEILSSRDNTLRGSLSNADRRGIMSRFNSLH
jgi:hypothetical protein